ncbi:D4Des, partial [Symbiodinium microadriaticum]
VYIHVNRAYVWYLTAVLGLFYAFIGLNIQHDANHGAVSRNPIVNRLLGLTQNWIGGSSVDWIHQHVVQHHVHTNDLHNDPDISGNALIRLNPLQPLLKYHMVQHIYIFLLIMGFGFSAVLTAIEHLFTGKHKTYMSSMLNGYRVFEFFATIPFIFRWVVIPYLLSPSVSTFLHIAPMFVTAGFYLAFFFVISHNFEGVQMFDKSQGLNYQIEHHLFPRMSHTHYPTIAPLVRDFCARKNIPYTHFPTISQNITSTVMHLYNFGNNEHPVQVTTSHKKRQ